MNCMATWEDGPEYAPIERPSDFRDPDAAPLIVAPPYAQLAAWAPKNRPLFDSPEKPVAPLSTLLPTREEPRDPQKPFAVVSSTMTTESAWGAVHWASPTGQPAGLPRWLAEPQRQVLTTHGLTNPWPSTPGTVPRQATSRRRAPLAGSLRARTVNSPDRQPPSPHGKSSTPLLQASVHA